MVFRSVAPFVVVCLSLIQLHTQNPHPGFSQPRIFNNVQAESEDISAVGPIDATMDTPAVARSGEIEADAPYVEPKTSTTMTTRQTGIELAGPSAVLAARSLSGSKAESLTPGESIFTLESERTPPLTTQWASGAKINGGQDPQIAAGHSVIAVLTWDTLTFYDKSGNPLPSINDPQHPENNFANPTSTEVIFAKLVRKMDQNLKLSPKTHGDPSFLFQPDGEVGDARVIFDNFRNRWVVLASAKNNHPDTTDIHLLTSQRRTKLLLAISRDEDPRHGFRTYGFNADPDDGACGKDSDASPCPGSHFTPGNGSDYPSLGVSKKHYIMTIGSSHATLDGLSHINPIAYMVTVNAHDAANGTQPIHTHAVWHWKLGEGDRAEGITMPAVMQNDLPSKGAGWGVVVSTVNDHFVLTGISPHDPPQLVTFSWDMPNIAGAPNWTQKESVKPVAYGNVGDQPITATVQGKTLTAGFVDCRSWTDSQKECSPSLHLVSVNLAPFPHLGPLVKERVIGWRSVLDDNPKDVVAYGLPGIASNEKGDIAVVYGRTSPKMFMETRFSTWIHDEIDIRPSRELQKGKAPIPPVGTPCGDPCKTIHPDTAGVSLDPFDSASIWIAHSFADSNSSVRVAVGKVFGDQHPDLWMWSANMTTPPTILKPGDQISVTFLMFNGGDGVAHQAHAELLLVAADGTKTMFGQTSQASMEAGDSTSTNLEGTIPASLAAGTYKVEVRAKLKAGEKQYAEDNDSVTAGTVHID
jgi:hypothetical protein